MKKRLASLYWRGILITLFMAFVATSVALWLKIGDTRDSLTAVLKAASRWTLDSNADLESLAGEIADVQPGMRATFLLDPGLVLADSEGIDRDAVDHSADPEIVAARKGGIGVAQRLSPEEGDIVLYMARRLSPQLLLRVSCPVLEIAETLALYSLGLTVLFFVLYLFQRRGIARFARDQERQLEEVRRLLDGEVSEAVAVFPEFGPSLEAISYRARRLREDQEEIRRTLNVRSDFVANASHELRSPLTSVRGYAEMLHEGLAESPEEREECLETILGECDRMLAVIEDILHLSKAEQAGRPQEAPRPVPPIAREVLGSLMPQAAKKRISLSCTGEAMAPASEKELWEILYNLTDNAVRYGRPDGHVWVRLAGATIEVADDGMGIAPEHVEHIFEQFYRVDEAREGAGGTGLGLSIVKAIVERSGGTIRAESRPGQGTRFIAQWKDETAGDERPEEEPV